MMGVQPVRAGGLDRDRLGLAGAIEDPLADPLEQAYDEFRNAIWAWRRDKSTVLSLEDQIVVAEQIYAHTCERLQTASARLEELLGHPIPTVGGA